LQQKIVAFIFITKNSIYFLQQKIYWKLCFCFDWQEIKWY